jgi:hypothetical protein
LFSELKIRLPLHERSDQLIKAAYEVDESGFNQLLDAIGDPNTSNGSGSLPLGAVAVSDNNFYVFYERFGRPKAGERDSDLKSRVCAAFVEARLRIARQLLQHGARVDGAGGVSWTPLMNAVTDHTGCGNEKMVQLLLTSGAAPNHEYISPYDSTSTSTPLWVAVVQGYLQAESGSQPLVDLLLRSGANANVKIRGQTPLMKLALDPRPEEFAQGDSSCWSADNSKVAVFRLLSGHSDLSSRLNSRDEFNGMTVVQILKKRLGGGCTRPQCDGTGRAGGGRCLERMLGALPH